MDNKIGRLKSLNRIRVNKYLNKINKLGKKRLTTILTSEAYEEIYKRRNQSMETGIKLTTGEIIEQALKETTQGLK
jgi:ribosomal protein S7